MAPRISIARTGPYSASCTRRPSFSSAPRFTRDALRNWQVSAMAVAQSGSPLTILDNNAGAVYGNFENRARKPYVQSNDIGIYLPARTGALSRCGGVPVRSDRSLRSDADRYRLWKQQHRLPARARRNATSTWPWSVLSRLENGSAFTSARSSSTSRTPRTSRTRTSISLRARPSERSLELPTIRASFSSPARFSFRSRGEIRRQRGGELDGGDNSGDRGGVRQLAAFADNRLSMPEWSSRSRQGFSPLGFPLEISTNSAEVLEAAAESWGAFKEIFQTPPLKIQVGGPRGAIQRVPSRHDVQGTAESLFVHCGQRKLWHQ